MKLIAVLLLFSFIQGQQIDFGTGTSRNVAFSSVFRTASNEQSANKLRSVESHKQESLAILMVSIDGHDLIDSSLRSESYTVEQATGQVTFSTIENQADETSILSKMSPDTSNDDCKFVSFEEWKKLKEAEHKSESALTTTVDSGKSLLASDIALLDASVNTSAASNAIPEDQGKIYKDKFNYASVKCAATVVETNNDAKGAADILTEVKDSYLINKCSTANKFIVIELCEDILVNSVVMGNYELFSSMFKTVSFYVSGTFPAVDGWRELGQFEAQNIRDVQSFDIKNPLIWARYLKIEIHSHYGNEFYCPVSIVRVHGTTMMEEVKNTDKASEKMAADISNRQNEAFLNYTEEMEPEECKARLPHLTLSDWLTELNSTREYCDSRESSNSSSIVESTNSITTQESIFQNIIKRLLLLESNSTLSLLYFEEQSKLLSEAFSSLEKRQNKRFESFAHRVNESMHLHSLINEEKIRKHLLQSFEQFKKSTEKAVAFTDDKILVLARELSLQRKIIIIETIIVLFLLTHITLTKAVKMSKKPSFLKNSGEPMRFPVKNRKSKFRRRKR